MLFQFANRTALRFTPGWALALLALSACGCTSFRDYVNNGFKVGPNYCPADATVAEHWIDESDKRIHREEENPTRWWQVFNDPTLNDLMQNASRQNLTLREAGFRILEAQATYNIAVGNIFPQAQTANGSYTRSANNAAGNPGSNLWSSNLSLAWELDFWGRFRRAVEQADASLDATIEDYDDVLVTLLSNVASTYVQMRVSQEQAALARANSELQREVLRIVEARYEVGHTSELDVDQAKSTLYQTEAQVPLFENLERQAQNSLCVLLGMPPGSLTQSVGHAPIPTAPAEVAIGIPADLLARRPDVRRAERNVAAQCAQIGITESNLYPHISITGSLGYNGTEFKDLFFKSQAFNGNVGPSFQWNILNYGRLKNAVLFQEARFQELLTFYKDVVLNANAEAENGLVTFLRSQERTKLLDASVVAAQKSVTFVVTQYKVGTVDFNRVAQIEQDLVNRQDLAAQAKGQIAQGLIQIYKAVGGGWQIRLEEGQDVVPITPPNPAAAPAQRALPQMTPTAPVPLPQEKPEAVKKPEPEKKPEPAPKPDAEKKVEPLPKP